MFMAYFVCVCGGWLCCSVEGLSVFMAYFVRVCVWWAVVSSSNYVLYCRRGA